MDEAVHTILPDPGLNESFNGAPPLFEDNAFLSPGTFSSVDDYAANPRFLELQEELRCVLFSAVSSLEPNEYSPALSDPLDGSSSRTRQSLDFTLRLIYYLKNWISECAPYLDKFDECRNFGVNIPILSQRFPALLYAMLAFSARQTERKCRLDKAYDSLELYQESIRLLAPCLQARDPNVLVPVCILAVMELMSVSPRDWRRHVEGCAALFDSFNVNGLSGGHLQAVFWCYARMELHSSETCFTKKAATRPDMHANWAVYLCAKTCDLACRQTRHMELGEMAEDPRPFVEQWTALWDELQFWLEKRPAAMLPIKTTGLGGGLIFPEILFAHWAAISGNQLYHAACIMMLDMKPPEKVLPLSKPCYSSIWHARRVCGISLTNPHSGNLINAIQPLYIAGKLLSHHSEHIEVARLFKTVEETTGWGALWRLRDLERAWGYEPGDILSAI
ncbi:hypothetical protein N7470_001586 [Penicillium chermesinum]|nr:hypothetical protein N7470_001586 [Penicillium chermesinum]